MASSLFWFLLFQLPLAAILTIFSFRLRSDAHMPQFIPATFDLLTLTAQDIAQHLSNQTFTSLQLTKEYLRRIELDDRSGLQLHTILRALDLFYHHDSEKFIHRSWT